MNPLLLTDGYKVGHHLQYPENTTLVYSNFTPRSNKYAPKGCDKIVSFGQQMTMIQIHESFQQNFFDKPKETVCGEMATELSTYLNAPYSVKHFEELHDLGYLPIEVKIIEEGNLVPMKIPVLTIHNTLPNFYWLPNFLETIISNLLWKPMTSATIAYQYRKLVSSWQMRTDIDNISFVDWQCHDFSMRGLDSVDATISSGLGHLTSFSGTDSLPTLYGARKYYGETGFIGGSVNATEHSVMCAGTKDDEIGTYRRLLETFPSGILSIVSDTWDLWKVCTEHLPLLKEEILARDGKVVIRPDSGDPVDIICGDVILTIDSETYEGFLEIVEDILHTDLCARTPHGEWGGNITDKFYFDGKLYEVTYSPDWNRHDKQYYYIDNYGGSKTTATEVGTTPSLKGVIELLWDVFGGTINSQGYKVLDPHIGAIYGDSITLERAEQICQRLELKGFASTNIVFGIGSFTYQYNTRDTFGFAMKATYVEVNGEGREIFKDPITDDGTKKSATGLLKVVIEDGEYRLIDKCSWEESQEGELMTLYNDGKFLSKTTLTEIKSKLL